MKRRIANKIWKHIHHRNFLNWKRSTFRKATSVAPIWMHRRRMTPLPQPVNTMHFICHPSQCEFAPTLSGDIRITIENLK